MAILSLLVGGIVGSILGNLLVSLWHPLGRSLIVLGSQPGTGWAFNLGIIGGQVGAWVHLNVLGVIGLVVGLGWYWRAAAR
jgi:hypothetical protein